MHDPNLQNIPSAILMMETSDTLPVLVHTTVPTGGALLRSIGDPAAVAPSVASGSGEIASPPELPRGTGIPTRQGAVLPPRPELQGMVNPLKQGDQTVI